MADRGYFMKNNRFQTLRFQLGMVILLFVLIPLIVSSAIFIHRTEASIISEQKKSVEKQLSLVSTNIDVIFSDMLSNVSFFANSSIVKGADNTLTTYMENNKKIKMTPSLNGEVEKNIFRIFKEFGESHPNYQYVYMGTENGGYIQYPEGNMEGPYDPRKRPWYPDAVANPEQPVLGKPYYWATDDIVIVGASQAIKDQNGSVIGVMALDMSLDSLTSLFQKASENFDGYFMLVGKDGTIIADPSNAENNFQNVGDIYGADFANAVSSNANYEEHLINEKPYVIKSVFSNHTGWNYVSVVDKSAIFQPVNVLKKIVYFTIAIVFLLAMFFGIVISRRITKPINALTQSAQEVAEGNFNVNIHTKASGEVGMLIDSFQQIGTTLVTYQSYIAEISDVLNQIAKGNLNFELESDYMGEFSKIKNALLNISSTLTETLSQIQEGSDQITSGSEQVASGAQALSHGTTEQAASVEELSANIRELLVQIGQNTKSTQKANTLSNEAGSEVVLANNDMEQLLRAMQEINDKSNEIGTIIKKIDDIAFQTNILALNAAVEAARAGNAGKGFAVVADEVRNLAQKSAEAAKETTALIESAVRAVNKGNELAEETRGSLDNVVAKAQNINELIHDITQASLQQEESIHQINIGVEQISSVVQTNAATAEESAATSEELSGQASVLNKLVNQFQLK